jgi:spore germination cell wall hydrolase CwlJ-like protein
MTAITLDEPTAFNLRLPLKGIMALVGFMLVMTLLSWVTVYKLNALRESSSLYKNSFVSAAERTKQLDCLTRNIYWEAANEPFEGKVAVAQVTMNRVESGKFANSVCGVVYQKNVVYEKVICQFSWFCEPTHKSRAIYQPLYRESEEVAKKVLLEGFRLPSLDNALYYHADYVSPGWRKEKVAKIGAHIFYKE